MRSINIIIDLDGTIYRGSQLVEHAKSFCTMLDISNIGYYFFTNCSKRTPREVAYALKVMGLDTKEKSIITSGCIARKYLHSMDKRMLVYVVGSDSFKDYLLTDNVELTNGKDIAADYVIVGFCTDFTYEDLTHALWNIQKGAKFITTNLDKTVPIENTTIPHTGAICAFLEYASKQKPINLGKPSRYAGDFFREAFGSDEILVIGDSVDTDMLFANNNGFTGCLVMTGTTLQRDTGYNKFHGYNTFNNLIDLHEFIECKIQGDSKNDLY